MLIFLQYILKITQFFVYWRWLTSLLSINKWQSFIFSFCLWRRSPINLKCKNQPAIWRKVFDITDKPNIASLWGYILLERCLHLRPSSTSCLYKIGRWWKYLHYCGDLVQTFWDTLIYGNYSQKGYLFSLNFINRVLEIFVQTYFWSNLKFRGGK